MIVCSARFMNSASAESCLRWDFIHRNSVYSLTEHINRHCGTIRNEAFRLALTVKCISARLALSESVYLNRNANEAIMYAHEMAHILGRTKNQS